EATIAQVLSLAPDRTALFGYAHVPWLKKHQQMIPDAALPGPQARFAQSQLAAQLLNAGGLHSIGFDHFARDSDRLALAAKAGRLRRNFQGYTDDRADVLIGLGASAIGQLPQGYVQNITPTGEYQKAVLAGNGATARGFALSQTDRLHGFAIEALLCRFALTRDKLRSHGAAGLALFEEARTMAAADTDGLVESDADQFRVTERGRPFVRTIAARFDTYLETGTARHSLAV